MYTPYLFVFPANPVSLVPHRKQVKMTKFTSKTPIVANLTSSIHSIMTLIQFTWEAQLHFAPGFLFEDSQVQILFRCIKHRIWVVTLSLTIMSRSSDIDPPKRKVREPGLMPMIHEMSSVNPNNSWNELTISRQTMNKITQSSRTIQFTSPGNARTYRKPNTWYREAILKGWHLSPIGDGKKKNCKTQRRSTQALTTFSSAF